MAVSLLLLQPLNTLLIALEKRGFLKKADRPTLLKVAAIAESGPPSDFMSDGHTLPS